MLGLAFKLAKFAIPIMSIGPGKVFGFLKDAFNTVAELNIPIMEIITGASIGSIIGKPFLGAVAGLAYGLYKDGAFSEVTENLQTTYNNVQDNAAASPTLDI